MGRGPASAYVAPFYGVSILLRSLLVANYAWRSSQGAFTFLSLFSRRSTSRTGSTAERLPAEIWTIIRDALYDIQYATAQRRILPTSKCSSCCSYKHGGGQFLGEMWDDFPFDEGDPARCCSKCGDAPDDFQSGRDILELVENLLPGLQRFLRLHGLHLPTHFLRRNDADTYEGADVPFTTFLALDAVNRPKAPLGADTVRRKRVSARSVSEQTDDVFELDTRIPPGADERIEAFLRDWDIEVVEEEMGVLKLRGVGQGVKKQAGEPRWTIFFFCESGEDEYH